MARSRAQVLQSARNFAKTGYYFGPGLCLKYSRICAGANGGVYDAHAAWANARFKHVTGEPPAGVPVFWSGGRHGHVAISSADWDCYSTDIKRSGRVDWAPMRIIRLKWGLTYVGWSSDINGVNILR